MLFFLCCTLCWMLLIFMLSAQEASLSSATSHSLALSFLSLLPFSHVLDYEAILPVANYILRTCAHFSEYFVLAVLFTFQALFYVINRKKRCLFSALFCLLYSISDEIHQIFVPGRSFQLFDIMIDFFGSVSGLLLAEALLQHIQIKKAQR